MGVLYAIYTPSLPFEVRCESDICIDIYNLMHILKFYARVSCSYSCYGYVVAMGIFRITISHAPDTEHLRQWHIEK